MNSLHAHVDYVRHVAANHGPARSEYSQHLNWYRSLHSQFRSGTLTRDDLNSIRNEFGDAYLTTNTLQGTAYLKPFGYAGDFSIIERIYDGTISPLPEFRKYDEFFHAQLAPQAVRNRKQYFKDIVRQVLYRFDEPICVLNLACGPCREMKELFDEGVNDVEFVCVDADANAVEYAKQMLREHSASVRFEPQNIIRFRSREKFHLIWSAGLFDYFDDRLFTRLLHRMLPLLKAGGEVVLGNFGAENPTRPYMEGLAEWYLHHRSDEQLTEIANAANLEKGDRIFVRSEPTGVNRFLHVARTGRLLQFDVAHDHRTSNSSEAELAGTQAEVPRD